MGRHTLFVAGAVITGCLTGLPVFADCKLPPVPNKVPDAAIATQEEILAAMQTLKHYSTDVTNYCKCLEFEAGQNRLTLENQQRLHNTAIDGLKAIAEKFNEQVRVFKERTD